MGLLFGTSVPVTLEVSGVTGTIAHDETITISTEGGENFGTKPDPDSRGTAKPLAVWRAEDNDETTLNTTLGDYSTFEITPRGDMVTTGSHAVNASRSYEASGSYLSDPDELGTHAIEVHTNWDEIYAFERSMYSHGRKAGEVVRTRLDAITVIDTGAVLTVGQWGRSQTSPFAHGQIESIVDDSRPVDTVYWDNTQGSISRYNEEEDFSSGGTTYIDIYATEAEAESGTGTILLELETSSAAAVVPFRTFNTKMMRFGLGNDSSINNIYMSDHQDVGSTTNHVENVGGTSYGTNNYTNQTEHTLVGGVWNEREFTLENGTVNTEDSIALRYMNGVLAYTSTDKKYIFTTTAQPNVFDRLVWHNNDNGFGLDVTVRMDYLYVDDSLCRVVIADSATLNIDDTTSNTTFEVQPCPIVSWSTSSIQCVVQKGQHTSLLGKYLHIVKSDGTVESSRQITAA